MRTWAPDACPRLGGGGRSLESGSIADLDSGPGERSPSSGNACNLVFPGADGISERLSARGANDRMGRASIDRGAAARPTDGAVGRHLIRVTIRCSDRVRSPARPSPSLRRYYRRA